MGVVLDFASNVVAHRQVPVLVFVLICVHVRMHM